MLIPVVVTLIAIFGGACSKGDKKGKKEGGGEEQEHYFEVITKDGVVDFDLVIEVMTDCSGKADKQAAHDYLKGIVEDCDAPIKSNSKRKRELDTYKASCSTVCILKSLKLLNDNDEFESDHDKLMEVVDSAKSIKDDGKKKTIVKEYEACSKIVRLQSGIAGSLDLQWSNGGALKCGDPPLTS